MVFPDTLQKESRNKILFVFSKLIDNVISKREVLTDDLGLLESEITRILKTNNQFSDLSYFISNKGKRIRSILFFRNWKCEIESPLKYKAPALIEIIHSASLLHDDVVDNNKKRRGGSSFLQSHGCKKSILVGDFALVKAFSELLKIFSEDEFLKSMCIRECSATAYGAVLEQSLNEQSTFQDCLRSSALKTASLFKLSCFLGTFLSSGDFSLAKKRAIQGLCFGIIYQFQNDLNCYLHENFEDSEDYMQKNITMPIIILFESKILDPSLFSEKSQQNYDKIRLMLSSKMFQKTAHDLLYKYAIPASDF